MKESVLITGASGFLGYHIINAALDNGLQVYAAIRSNSNVKHLDGLPIKFVTLDYVNDHSLENVFAEYKFDYVIHAAGTTKANSEQEYDLVNNKYTCKLAMAAAKFKGQVKRFVFISSLAATGPLKQTDGIICEDKMPAPVTAYGRSKLNAEISLKQLDLPVTILRPTAIYGPREKDIFVVAQYLSKGFDPYIGRASQRLSFVYAKDMAGLAVQVLRNANADGVYNITDGKVYSRYEFADIVKQLIGKKAIRLHLPVAVVKAILYIVEKVSVSMNKVPLVTIEKLGELMAPNWNCDIHQAQEKLAFVPKYDLQKGLKESVDWYLENKWLIIKK